MPIRCACTRDPEANPRYPGCYDCQFTCWHPWSLIRLSLALNDFVCWLRSLRPNVRCWDCGAASRRWWRRVDEPCDCPPF